MPDPMTTRKSHKDKAFVYHLTHVENLASIAEHGLLPRRELTTNGLPFADVADPQILSGRGDHGLDARVPFHFMPLSPFDGAVVAKAQDKRFVLLAVYRKVARDQGWVVVPRHPLAAGAVPEICAWDEGVHKIEWEQMDRFSRPYDTDHHCKMVCMAEALSPGAVNLDSVAALYAPTQPVLDLARARLQAWPRLKLNLNPAMFPGACR